MAIGKFVSLVLLMAQVIEIHIDTCKLLQIAYNTIFLNQ